MMVNSAVEAPISEEIKLDIDDSTNRLAVLLLKQMDHMPLAELDRLNVLLGDFEWDSKRAMRATQAHKAFAHIGFLYVNAIRDAHNKWKKDHHAESV